MNWRAAAAEGWRREARGDRAGQRPAGAGARPPRRGAVHRRFRLQPGDDQRHAPGTPAAGRTATPAATAAAFAWARAGAAAERLDNVSAWRFITPPSPWPRGIVVNTRGERFCNEQVYGATLGHAMVEQQGGKAWLILDSKLRGQSIRECLFGGLWAFQALPALGMMLLGEEGPARWRPLAGRIGADPALLVAPASATTPPPTAAEDDQQVARHAPGAAPGAVLCARSVDRRAATAGHDHAGRPACGRGQWPVRDEAGAGIQGCMPPARNRGGRALVALHERPVAGRLRVLRPARRGGGRGGRRRCAVESKQSTLHLR